MPNSHLLQLGLRKAFSVINDAHVELADIDNDMDTSRVGIQRYQFIRCPRFYQSYAGGWTVQL